MKQGLTLGLLPPLGGSLATLAEAGQHTRLINHYLRAYARVFDSILYFSYADEQLVQYTQDKDLLSHVSILPGRPRRLYTFSMPIRYAQHIRESKVLRVYQATGAVPAMVARVLWNIPVVVTYGYRYAEFAWAEKRPKRALMLWILERIGLWAADTVIVTTPELAEYVSRWVSEDRIQLIPNGVDTAQFRPPASWPENEVPVGIFVGRLESQKNLLALLEAVALVGGMRLVLIGEGSQRDLLTGRARELGVDLELTGVIDHSALPALLQRADLFVIPSLAEGHPKALIEAMSVGLPCVGTNVPGIRALLQEGETGILCSGTDAGSLAEGLRWFLNHRDEARSIGRRARELVKSRYDLDTLLERETDLLVKLASRRMR